MSTRLGSNSKDMRALNRNLVLKLVATAGPLSRNEISNRTNLTKMTASNIISELISLGIVHEIKQNEPEFSSNAGRKPGLIDIAPSSPCICGIFVGRRSCTVLLSDYRANMIDQHTYIYGDTLNGETLVNILVKQFYNLTASCGRPIAGLGISSIGPLNTAQGIIVRPQNFYGIHDMKIVDLLEQRLGLRGLLINDATSGALAEKLYGYGRNEENFIYLHLHDGIGAGMIVDNECFDGNTGLSGEIGHTSINFMGPKCECGNNGCLELYANERNIIERAKEMLVFHKNSSLWGCGDLNWRAIVNAADQGDALAVSVLDSYCEYLSYSLVNCLKLMDLDTIFLGYECDYNTGMIEKLLEYKINRKLFSSGIRKVRVVKSKFRHLAPVTGSVAVVADAIFSGKLPFWVPDGARRTDHSNR